jgi:hypothetical protein
MKPAPKEAQFIAPDNYPQMMGRQDAARALGTLRSAQTAAKAQAAMQACVAPMRAAILQYVDEMEQVATDNAKVFAKVHEIRGFAETAGLVNTGRISDILCRYMDDMERIGKPVDSTIVALHVSAIARAARAEDEDVRMGDAVVHELAALVARRLAEAQRGQG